MIRVLYIAGFARSGTTILGNLLGEVDRFTHLGEVHHLWARCARAAKNRCGCGEGLTKCDVWSPVLRQTLGKAGLLDATTAGSEALMHASAAALRVQKQALRRGVYRHMLGSGPEHASADVLRYARLLETLYKTAADAFGSDVLIDSSKKPMSGAMLSSVAGVQPCYVHLVRDPRGVVLSRQRRSAPRVNGQVRLRTTTAVADALRWSRSNLLTEWLMHRSRARHLFITYTDFVREPDETVRMILELLDAEDRSFTVLASDGTVSLRPNHTIGGNRNRFQTGSISIKADIAWMRDLSLRDQWLVSVLTAPVLRRYGYPIAPGRSERAASPSYTPV